MKKKPRQDETVCSQDVFEVSPFICGVFLGMSLSQLLVPGNNPKKAKRLNKSDKKRKANAPRHRNPSFRAEVLK